MRTYYEILELDIHASKEIIDKAYRTLVKKYHPDLKEHHEKTDAETKIKEINEAYEVLSNTEKKQEYDKNLKSNYISIEEYNLLVIENNTLKQRLNNLENNILSKLDQKNNFDPNVNNVNLNRNNSYTQPNNNYNPNKKSDINNNNYSYESYKNTIPYFLFSKLRNIFILIFKYFFILLLLFIFCILIRKHFFYNIFDFFNFKDLLIIAGILFFIIYSFKQK